MDKILVLDFGSRTSVLIGRRIRELGIYSEVIPGDSPMSDEMLGKIRGADGYLVRGIIFSGSRDAVYDGTGAVPDQKVYDSGLPILGICYGLERMIQDTGGSVGAMPQRETGAVQVKGRFPEAGDGIKDYEKARRFFAAFDRSVSLEKIKKGALAPVSGEWTINSWMSHGDEVKRLATGFKQFAESASGSPSVLVHESRPWFALQYHPEVIPCERALEVFAAFAFGAAGCRESWNMESYVNNVRSSLAAKTGTSPVLLLISGGVDSTVTGALLLKTLKPGQVHLMYMDTGLMRKNETENVKAALECLGAEHLHIIHCEDEFLSALKGVTDPETKRKIIGDLFITIQERETKRLSLPENCFLAQGTIYPDIIESGRGAGNKAHVIKSHHNVGSRLVREKREAGLIIEPLDKLYKDEVRELGRYLGLSEDTVNRHPFPGPGLAVRVIGEVTKERCDILREADAVYMEELKKRKAPSGKTLYEEIWQAFPVLLPIRSVGNSGGVRSYGWVLALRAITSTDAMTANVYQFQIKDILEISAAITEKVKDIGRVTYDISNKPPATIEWE